jgi:hypothetical protein
MAIGRKGKSRREPHLKKEPESMGKRVVKANGNGTIDINGKGSPVCGRARDFYFR